MASEISDDYVQYKKSTPFIRPQLGRGKKVHNATRRKMKIRGADFVVYQVFDIKRAAAFYRETLSLPQEICSEEYQWAEFNCGNVTLSLHGGVKLPDRIAGGRIALAVDDIHAAYTELKAKGIRIVGEPVDYGVCCAMEILDPDGNTVILHKRADGTFGQSPPNIGSQEHPKHGSGPSTSSHF